MPVLVAGLIAGLALLLAAALIAAIAVVRTVAHAKAIVPTALLEKFAKAQNDLVRIRAAAEALRRLPAVPTANRD